MNIKQSEKKNLCRKGQDIPLSCDVPHDIDVEFEGTFCYNIKVWIGRIKLFSYGNI